VYHKNVAAVYIDTCRLYTVESEGGISQEKWVELRVQRGKVAIWWCCEAEAEMRADSIAGGGISTQQQHG